MPDTDPPESNFSDLHSVATTAKLDTQMVELLGRNCLIDQLLRAGLEVAIPERDRGVDLVAYSDLAAQVDRFSARPLQLKAASKRTFSLDKKYERISDLILVYVWHVDDPRETVIFALTYAEALGVADEMGWTATASWRKGKYANTRPGQKLQGLLEPYLMTPERWVQRIVGA